MLDPCVGGEQFFLPSETLFLFKSQVAIARYSGWQIAYMLWGKCLHVTCCSSTPTPQAPAESWLWVERREVVPGRRHSASNNARTFGGRMLEGALQGGPGMIGSRRASGDRVFPWPPGYLIIHVVQSLCGMLIMYSLVLPVVHNQGLEMLQGLGIGT